MFLVVNTDCCFVDLQITLSKKHTIVAVDINILDVNDHTPVFNRDVYDITVDESTQQGMTQLHRTGLNRLVSR